MAKERKKKSRTGGFTLSPLLLFLIATISLAAGWLMPSFPLLIMVGLSPLFALVDTTHSEEKFWNHSEFILVAVAVSLWAAHVFQLDQLISSIIQAIAYTLAFVAFGFVRQSLGDRAGKFTVIIFWLAIEYVFLKINWPTGGLFLADAVQLKPDWHNWTHQTGYLGSSLWILLANLLFYLAVLKEGKLNWLWGSLFLLLVACPIVFSLFTSDLNGISRNMMISFYANSAIPSEPIYLKRGEFIPRTAAWISILIFIFALVKSKTQKK